MIRYKMILKNLKDKYIGTYMSIGYKKRPELAELIDIKPDKFQYYHKRNGKYIKNFTLVCKSNNNIKSEWTTYIEHFGKYIEEEHSRTNKIVIIQYKIEKLNNKIKSKCTNT